MFKDIFESPYDTERYKSFIRELFHQDIMVVDRSQAIGSEFQDQIESVKKFTSAQNRTDQLLILAIALHEEKGNDWGRRKQRNFVAKILREQDSQAALVAFYMTGSENWRLSFVKNTPLTRCSFLLGRNESSYMTTKQWQDLLLAKTAPTPQQIEAVFRVEQISKLFFEQYKVKFMELKEYLGSEEYAKQVLAQLSFRYFLQKKGMPYRRIPSFNEDVYASMGRLPDDFYTNERGTGIWDIFGLYKFTMHESEQYDTEVAINPEMLGMVFERLLNVKDRKSKGTFYTPGEIVHYMCQESLVNYVTNQTEIAKKDLRKFFSLGELPPSLLLHGKKVDQVLQQVRIVDPAVGSGAFLLGMLNEIVKARILLRTCTPYQAKMEAIKNSVYAIDIERSAVEITQMRLWLSLLVEAENDAVDSLPNLNENIRSGNSLTEKVEVAFAKIFDEKGGFDIVIGNPPYGAELNGEQKQSVKRRLVDTKNMNTAAIFIDFAKNYLLNQQGTLAFIVPKSLLYSEKWYSLVIALLEKTESLIDVEKAFESVKLEQVVFVYNHALKTKTYQAKKFSDQQFIRSNTIETALVQKYKAWICDMTPEELEILRDINVEVDYLHNISTAKRGAGLQQFLAESGDYPVLGGKNIYRFGHNGIKGYLTKEVMEKHKDKHQFLQNPKILSQDLIAHIQNPKPHILLTSFYDESGEILSLDTVQNTILTDENYDYRYILGLLNSNFVSWYTYRFIYCSAIRTMHFDKNYMGRIIIPKLSKEKQEPIIQLVKEIERHGQTPPSKKYTQELNHIIYQLYGLTPQAMEVIESSHQKF